MKKREGKREGSRLFVRRWLSILLILAMTFTMNMVAAAEEMVPREIPDNIGVTVDLQIEGYNETIHPRTSVTMPQEYHKLSEYGFPIADESDPGYFTVLHALAEYEIQAYGLEREYAGDLISAGETGYIMDIEGYVGSNWDKTLGINIWRNGSAIMQSCAEEKLEEGDLLVFGALWYFWDGSALHGTSYCRFSDIPTEAKAGKEFRVGVTAVDSMNVSDAAGITIIALDTEGNEIASGVTGGDGYAGLRVGEPGIYNLTATRRAPYYAGNEYAVNITIPQGTIAVAEGEQLTDEDAVAKVSTELSMPSEVTESLVLPSEADYGVQIAWISGDESVIAPDGTVTRSIMKDSQVELTATISRGNVSETKKFSVSVKGLELLESLSVNKGILNPREVRQGSYQSEYMVFLPKDTDEVVMKVRPSDKATMLMGGGIFSFDGEEKETTVEVGSLKEGESKDVELKIWLGSYGQGAVTVTFKKYGKSGNVLPDLPAFWGQYLGGADNNAVVEADTPTGESIVLWESRTEEEPDEYGTAFGGRGLLVNGKLYVVRNHQIQILNASTGEVQKKADLIAETGYYSIPTYGDGKIFVPLGDGSVQCFHASTLESLFVTYVPEQGMTGLSSIHYHDGMIYVGYTNGAFMDDALRGGFAAYETTDADRDITDEPVAPVWVYEGNGSYYGMGGVTVQTAGGAYLVFAGDDGIVVSADPKSGEIKSKKQVEGKVRSSMVYADGAVWFTSQAGKVYKFAVGMDGTLVKMAEADLPSTTNASPVIAGGKVFVTGGNWRGGYFHVYDTGLKLLAKTELHGPGNTPSATVSDGNVYVYFTQNASPDGIYMAKVTSDNQITLTNLYTSPEEKANYCMSNVVIGEDGTLYYTNDSGYLFAIGKKKTPDISGTDPKPAPEQKPQPDTGKTESSRTPSVVHTAGDGQNRKMTDSAETASIAETIKKAAEAGEKTLTITTIPDQLGAEVFAELAKFPNLCLVLDYQTYTLSMKGADVTNPSAVLTARLVEKESSLDEMQVKLYGKHQMLGFENAGPLPGKVTVVYRLPDSMKSVTSLYLYSEEAMGEPVETVLKDGYAMFTLEKSGNYLLAENEVSSEITESVDKGAGDRTDAGEECLTENAPMAGWLPVAVGGGMVILLGVGSMAVVLNRKRGKEKTWEEE